MSKLNTLFDLFQLTEEEIHKIIENSKNAKMIYDFINKSVKSDGADLRNEIGFEDVDDFFVAGAIADDDKPKAGASSGSGTRELLKKSGPKPRTKRGKK